MHASIILAVCSMAAAMTWLIQIHDWSAMLAGLTVSAVALCLLIAGAVVILAISPRSHWPAFSQASDRPSDEISLT